MSAGGRVKLMISLPETTSRPDEIFGMDRYERQRRLMAAIDHLNGKFCLVATAPARRDRLTRAQHEPQSQGKIRMVY